MNVYKALRDYWNEARRRMTCRPNTSLMRRRSKLLGMPRSPSISLRHPLASWTWGPEPDLFHSCWPVSATVSRPSTSR